MAAADTQHSLSLAALSPAHHSHITESLAHAKHRLVAQFLPLETLLERLVEEALQCVGAIAGGGLGIVRLLVAATAPTQAATAPTKAATAPTQAAKYSSHTVIQELLLLLC